MNTTVVRPAMVNGADTWAAKKVQEKKLDVAEITMFRCMCAVTKVGRIKNIIIRGSTKVGKV